MKNTLSKTVYIALAGMLAPVVTACDHKDMMYEGQRTEIEVIYDWRNAPDANPASMGAVLFENNLSEPLSLNFKGREGGLTHVPAGMYNVLGMNNDNTDWAHHRNPENIETLEIYTQEATTTSAYRLPTRAIPRAEGSEDEPIVETPGMLWSDRQDQQMIRPAAGRQVITLYPQEDVCHYTVDVYDIKNPGHMPEGSIDATLSGMAEGFRYGPASATDTKVTLPFALTKANTTPPSLHGEFLTFGESPVRRNPHKLTIYYVQKDGSRKYAVYDVGSQVSDAADRRHVHIVVRGLEFPDTVIRGGGLLPDVNEWEAVNINLPMRTIGR